MTEEPSEKKARVEEFTGANLRLNHLHRIILTVFLSSVDQSVDAVVGFLF